MHQKEFRADGNKTSHRSPLFRADYPDNFWLSKHLRRDLTKNQQGKLFKIKGVVLT